MTLVVVLAVLTGCSGHRILLTPPPYADLVPPIETGFYEARYGQDVPEKDRALGRFVYLYKDDFFRDGEYYLGLKGSFLPDCVITTEKRNGRALFTWNCGEEGEAAGVMEIEVRDRRTLFVRVREAGEERSLAELRYVAPHLWSDSVSTVPIAHRGVSYQPPSNRDGVYPANTIPAFETALRSGFGGFELDVRVTTDGHFVVSHDEDLSVSTTAHGLATEKQLADFADVLVVKSAFVPENASTASTAYIAAPVPSMREVLDTFIDDPRLRTIGVDVKPNTAEKIGRAARNDFSGLTEQQQRKLMFMTRDDSCAERIRDVCPFSDIALEGSFGTEPAKDTATYFPESIGRPRSAHNTISFGAYLSLTMQSVDGALETLNRVARLSESYDYRLSFWTISKQDQLDLLRTHYFRPDYLLTDLPYYQYALQELRYKQDDAGAVSVADAPRREYLNPIYKRMYTQFVHPLWYEWRNIVSVAYGSGVLNHGGLAASLPRSGSIEAMYGKSELRKYSPTNVDLSERYGTVSYATQDLSPGIEENSTTALSYLRFSLATNDGLGYGGRTIAVIPYVSIGFDWTRLATDGTEGLTADDADILGRYTGAFRFGESYQYGVKMEVSTRVQLYGAYKTGMVFPRHMFWYWAGSTVLTQGVYGIASHYLGKLSDDLPVVGPILNFALKSGYLYGLYLLRKDDMNWPFSTEAPMRDEMFSLGFATTF